METARSVGMTGVVGGLLAMGVGRCVDRHWGYV
jgi:hypothetical protein